MSSFSYYVGEDTTSKCVEHDSAFSTVNVEEAGVYSECSDSECPGHGGDSV
jgi:hypothetical protein